MRTIHRSWFTYLMSLAAALVIFTTTSVADPVDEPQQVRLHEAVELALEESLSIKASKLEVEDMRLALAQAEAENLIKPNPALLIQAQRNLEIALQKLIMERYNTSLAVEEAFYNVLKAQDYVDIGGRALELAEHQLRAARGRFAAGMGTQSEVMDYVGKVAEARANLAKAEGSHDLALLSFRQTMGVPLNANIIPSGEEPIFLKYCPDLAEDINFALSNRVEALEVQGLIDAAHAQVSVSRNNYTPELILKRALVAEEKAANGFEQLKYGIELEVRQAYLILNDLSHRVEVEEENLAAAEENLRIAEKLLEADMTTPDQVMAAEVGVEQAKMNLRHTYYDYNLAKLRYDKAVARPFYGSEMEGGK